MIEASKFDAVSIHKFYGRSPCGAGKALEAWAVVSQPALLAGGAVLGASLLLHATGVDASLPVRFLWGSVAKPFPNGLPTRLLLSGNDSYSSENDNH